MSQGRAPAFDVLDQAMDVQTCFLELWDINEEMLTKSAPGGLWESPETHAYCTYLRTKLAETRIAGARLCGTLDRLGTIAHAHEKRETLL